MSGGEDGGEDGGEESLKSGGMRHFYGSSRRLAGYDLDCEIDGCCLHSPMYIGGTVRLQCNDMDFEPLSNTATTIGQTLAWTIRGRVVDSSRDVRERDGARLPPVHEKMATMVRSGRPVFEEG